MRWAASVFLFALGLALLAPVGYVLFGRKPELDFGSKAFKPVFRIPLRELAASRQLTRDVVLPSEAELGALDFPRRFLVTAASSEHTVQCWPELGIDITATVVGRHVPVKPIEGTSYGWSSTCLIGGVWFPARSEDRVKLVIRAGALAELPTGELLLIPYWREGAKGGMAVKDRMVGMSIDKLIISLSWFTTPLAVGLFAVGAWLFRWKPSQF